MIVKDLDAFRQLRFLKKYLRDTQGVIAGGCFKNIFVGDKPKDIDVFFCNIRDYKSACNNLIQLGYEEVYESENVKAFKDEENGIVLELVKKTFGHSDIINKFDFTVTKFCAYLMPTFDEEETFEVMYAENFFEDLFLKRLYIDDELLFPISTFERTLKYAKYGFQPCRETKRKLILAINQTEEPISISKSLYDGID